MQPPSPTPPDQTGDSPWWESDNASQLAAAEEDMEAALAEWQARRGEYEQRLIRELLQHPQNPVFSSAEQCMTAINREIAAHPDVRGCWDRMLRAALKQNELLKAWLQELESWSQGENAASDIE